MLEFGTGKLILDSLDQRTETYVASLRSFKMNGVQEELAAVRGLQLVDGRDADLLARNVSAQCGLHLDRDLPEPEVLTLMPGTTPCVHCRGGEVHQVGNDKQLAQQSHKGADVEGRRTGKEAPNSAWQRSRARATAAPAIQRSSNASQKARKTSVRAASRHQTASARTRSAPSRNVETSASRTLPCPDRSAVGREQRSVVARGYQDSRGDLPSRLSPELRVDLSGAHMLGTVDG